MRGIDRHYSERTKQKQIAKKVCVNSEIDAGYSLEHEPEKVLQFGEGNFLRAFVAYWFDMHGDTVLGYMNRMLLDEIVPILPLDQRDCKQLAAAVQDRFNNPFVNHELMSISLNPTSKWRARNMPGFLEYIEKNGKLPTCLTMRARVSAVRRNLKEAGCRGEEPWRAKLWADEQKSHIRPNMDGQRC